MKRLLLALGLVVLASPAPAQNAITQEGSVLQNSPVMFRGNNRARQGAGVGGAPTGQMITTGDAVAGGRCDYSNPTDQPYYVLCLDAATGRIRFGGTQTPSLGLSFDINGSIYGFPGPGNGNVMGPTSSSVGSLAFFNGTTGTPLSENRLSVSGYYYPATVGQAVKSTAPSQDPAALLALEKTYDTGGLPPGAPVPRPTLYSACKLAAVGTDVENKSCRGALFEGIDNVGGFGTFVEGVKGVAIGTFTSGTGGGVYGGIMWGQSYNSQYTVGVEAQTARTNGGDAPGPRGFIKERFIAGFMYSNGLGSVGDRADVGFLINPYNPKKTSVGFMCSADTIEATAGLCFGDWGGSAVGIDLSLGGPSPHTLAAMLISNQDPISFFKTDGNLGVGMYMGADDVLHLGGVIGQQVTADGTLAVAGNITANANITIFNNANLISSANYVVRGVAAPTLIAGTWTIWTDSATAQLKATFGTSPFTMKVLAP